MIKYLEIQLKQLKYPVVIVQHQKHEPVHYLANNRKELMRVFVKMLNMNWGARYYYKPDKPDLKEELTEEQIAVLPKKYHATERGVREDNARAQARYDEGLEDYCRIKKALDEKNGESAFEILHFRKGAEYEDWEFVHLIKV